MQCKLYTYIRLALLRQKKQPLSSKYRVRSIMYSTCVPWFSANNIGIL